MSLLRVIVAGHVDHGKSTLIGRLLHDTKSLPDTVEAALQETARARGGILEWSYLLDSLQAERDQAVTIETTQAALKTAKRAYILIDAPGHREFLKNMMTGASQADAAILVVEAGEGLRAQTKRHAHLIALMGLTNVIVVINKMDAAGFDQAVFEALAQSVRQYLQELGLTPSAVIPASAQAGEGLTGSPASMPWYHGTSVLDALDQLPDVSGAESDPLRLLVQDIYRHDGKRIIAGYLQGGSLKVGDPLVFFPQQEKTIVSTLEAWPDNTLTQAGAGDCIGLTLVDDLYVERGFIACHADTAPPAISSFNLQLLWLSQAPLVIGQEYRAHFGPVDIPVTAVTVEQVIEFEENAGASSVDSVGRHALANVTFRIQGSCPLMVSDHLTLFGKDGVVAGGVIRHVTLSPKSSNIFPVHYAVTPAMRAGRNHHTGGIFWLTGLSGAGKSTLAMAVEQELFQRGIQAYALDGDNMRRGLTSDLGFSPEDRRENIRRTGEVAALLCDAGLVVLTAFISPYRQDREKVQAMAPGGFHEIFVKADLETCEARDPKGLYKKVRAGEIKEFTGIDAPYEAPLHPALILDTQKDSVDICARQLTDYILEKIRVPHVPAKF